jgi:glucose/arabinose dehydrogenase
LYSPLKLSIIAASLFKTKANKMTCRFCLLILLTALLGACKNEQKPSTADAEKTAAPSAPIDSTIKLPAGFKATVVIENLPGRARHFAINANGDLYVHMPDAYNGHGIAALRDTTGDGAADQVEFFGSPEGTGMGINNGYLYFSNTTTVYRYKLSESSLTPDENSKEMVVGGFPEQNEHNDKPFCFDNNGHIYITVGAPSNACQVENRAAGSKGQDPCPQLEFQAGIWQFSLDKTAQSQTKDGKRYSYGIRNAMAVEWNAATNGLFALQHGRDQLSEFWPKLFNAQQNAELPAEEFLQINDGDFFGWPYCYFDHLQNKKILGPEYGGDSKKQGRCESVKPPVLAFPGHMAPNDLVFCNNDYYPEKYRQGAFIAFHGSWNRSPQEQKGYLIAFVPMKHGKVAGEWEVFAEGFAGISPIMSPGDAKHRPTGLGFGPDGALYVSDSVKGKIWKIVRA